MQRNLDQFIMCANLDTKKIKIVTRIMLSKMKNNDCRVCKKIFILGQSYTSKPTTNNSNSRTTYYHGECAVLKGVLIL